MQQATKTLLSAICLTAASALITQVSATCWDEASNDYGVPVDVLKAVAKTESGFRPNAINKNKDGSEDVGFMQINSSHLATLGKYGITRESLLDACINLKVGAWILSENSKRLGWNWDAIGAYNVGCAKLDRVECNRRRASYAWKVYSALKTQTKGAATKKSEREGEVSNASNAGIAAARKTMVIAFSAIGSEAGKVGIDAVATPNDFLAYNDQGNDNE